MPDAFEPILRAHRPEEIFGNDSAMTLDALRRRFHQEARQVHPDLHGGSKKAVEAFARLNNLLSEAEARIDAKIYGSKKPTPTTAPVSPTVITHKKGKYVVTESLGVGDICALHQAIYTEGSDEQLVLLKVARNPNDNDLVEHEAKALTELIPKGTKREKFYRYLPNLITSFKLPQPGGPRQVNVFDFDEGYYTLAEIKQAYPHGIAFEDAVWMFNRMLEGIGFVHSKGWVHGAVIPAHVLICPPNHAALFVDWSYATKINDKIKAISAAHEGFYAPEVLQKNRATQATDIYMIAKCIMDLVDKRKLPNYIERFWASCLLAAPSRRPNDAWVLRDEFEQVMRTNYGPRKYHKFVMPD